MPTFVAITDTMFDDMYVRYSLIIMLMGWIFLFSLKPYKTAEGKRE